MQGRLIDILNRSFFNRTKMRTESIKSVDSLKSHDFDFIHQAAKLLKDFDLQFTVTSLALEVGINEKKLKIGFRQLYSSTVHQYRLTAQLDRACILLKDSDLSVKEIARKVGFGRADTFTRCFREKYLVSPREWRRDAVADYETSTWEPVRAQSHFTTNQVYLS